MKKISIQGHPTKGHDIIKILESLGGINSRGYTGYDHCFYYYINTRNYIDCDIDENLPQGYKKYTLEEYKQKYNMETKRTIQIDFNTAKEWYKQGGNLKEIALQAFSEDEFNPLPKSWKEYCKINPYINKNKEFFITENGNVTAISQSYFRSAMPFTMPSEKRAEQFLILNKLLQIRDYYNQGWEPNWNDCTDKYVIWSFENKLYSDVSTCANSIFAFESKEVRDTFFENFENDLEKIKEFL